MDGALGRVGRHDDRRRLDTELYGAASATDTIAFSGAGGTLKMGDTPGLPNGMTLTGCVR